MLAKDIMTKNVVTVKPSTSIEEAMTLLIEKRISGLVVTQDDGQVLGVITEKDLLVAYDFLRDIKDTIHSFICKDIISVEGETSIDEISRMLVQRNIKRVPVMKDGKIEGIVSRRDVIRSIVQPKE